jgi:hypothetical protein
MVHYITGFDNNAYYLYGRIGDENKLLHFAGTMKPHIKNGTAKGEN